MGGFNKGALYGTFNQNNIDDWLKYAAFAAMGSSKKDRNRGYSYSPKEIAEKQFARFETEDERQYQQDFYDRNYSFQGQVNQMQSAGLNPSLLYGGMSSTASSGSSGDTISAPTDGQTEDSPVSQFGSVINLLSSVLGLSNDAASLGNSIENSKVQRDFTKQQTKTEAANTQIKEVEASNAQFNTYLEQLLKLNVIDKSKSDAISAAYNAEVLKGVDPKIASKHIINMYSLDENLAQANIDKLGSDVDLNNSQMQKIHFEIEFIKAQTKTESVRRALFSSEIARNNALITQIKSLEDYYNVNAAYTQSLKEDKDAQVKYDNFCNEHGLPKDQPVVVSSVMRLDAVIDDCNSKLKSGKLSLDQQRIVRQRLNDAFEVRSKIYDAVERQAKGNMSKAERTQYWSKFSLDVVNTAAHVFQAVTMQGGDSPTTSEATITYSRNAAGNWYESGRTLKKYQYKDD